MARTLTKKQKGFVKDYVKTGNGTKAAFDNFDITPNNENSAAAAASRALSNVKVQEAIASIEKKAADRIPDELLAQKHLEGLDATQVRFTPEGEQIRVEDFATRHKYVDSGYKLKGSYAPEKSQALHVNIEGQILANTEFEAIRQKYEAELKAKLLQ